MTETQTEPRPRRKLPHTTGIDVSCVIPVGPEGADFHEIIQRFGHEFGRRGATSEFIFVLDGAPDSLFEEYRKAKEELDRKHPEGPSLQILTFNQAFGESIALSAGFKVARGHVVISLPPYLQIEPRDIHNVLDAIAAGADVVTCCRYPRVDPALNRLQSWIFNLLMRLLTGVRVHDLNCIVRAMRRRVFDGVTVQGDMYRFLPVLAHRAGYSVSEVRVRHLRERGRWGFFGIGVYIRRVLDVATLLFLTKFTRKPLRFFGLAGGFFSLLGVSICAGLALQGKPLSDRPLLILGVLLIVLGVQTFFIGFVAEIIIFTQARNLKDYKVDRYEGGGPAAG
ncbi:MAG: glycosyltransferase [Planctomycetota bacterium]